jgi:NAD dependent epimerase/dehydratase family enzyme
MRVPALPVRLALGEMAGATILGGQRVVPAKATALGFKFKHPRIDDALAGIYRR